MSLRKGGESSIGRPVSAGKERVYAQTGQPGALPLPVAVENHLRVGGLEVSALLRQARGRTVSLTTSTFVGTEAQPVPDLRYTRRGVVSDLIIDNGPYAPGDSDIRGVRVTGATLEQDGKPTINRGETVLELPGSLESAEIVTTNAGTTITWGEPLEGYTHELKIPKE